MKPINKGQGYQTAIFRKTLSVPMRIILEIIGGRKALDGKRCLDFGSGRGFDANELGIEKYDPNWGPTEIPDGEFDFIFCNYVLNVIPDDDLRTTVIRQIQDSLKPDGMAYISVRADVPVDTKTQWDIRLSYKNVYDKKGKCRIYRIEKES